MLRSFLKTEELSSFLSLSVRLFHISGPITLKHLAANVFLVV